MTIYGDDIPEMRNHLEPDERDVDAVLRGRRPAHRPDLEPLAQLVADLHLASAAPARPSAALAALLASGLAPVESPLTLAPAPPVRRGAAAVRWATSLRTAAKGGLLAAIAVLGVASAATAGVLPAAVQDKLSTAVETVTPWHIPRPAGHGIGELVREKARHHGQDKDKHGNSDPSTPAVVPPGQSGKPEHPGNSDHSKVKSGHDDASESESPESEAPEPSESADSGRPAHPGNSDHSASQSKPAHSPDPADSGDDSGGQSSTGAGSGSHRQDGSHTPAGVPSLHPEPRSGK